MFCPILAVGLFAKLRDYDVVLPTRLTGNTVLQIKNKNKKTKAGR